MGKRLGLFLIGTRIRVKGDKNIDGHIISWLADDKREMTGYLVRSDEDPKTLIVVGFDDNFEVIGT